MSNTFSELPDTTIDQIMIANSKWPAFQREHEDAINTTIGVLVDPETSRPWQPKTIIEARQKALKEINRSHNYGYQTQTGNDEFLHEAGKMVFDSQLYERSAADLLAYQSLGGTGALSVTRDTLLSLVRLNNKAAIPLLLDPGWPNHNAIFTEPFEVHSYDHLNPKDGKYNHQAALDAIDAATDNSIMLFQTCGYNDDGADRTREQWAEICDAAQKKNAIVILDSAYLGLAEGLNLDRYPIELCLSRGLLTFICVSFSKSMGFYNERVGALFIANAKQCIGAKQTLNLNQLVMRIVRRTISSTPFLAAQSAAIGLQQPGYYEELEAARLGIVANRQAIAKHLVNYLPNIGSGSGLFTKLLPGGFTPKQRELLEAENIFVLPNSRLNLGGMRIDQVERAGVALTHALKASS